MIKPEPQQAPSLNETVKTLRAPWVRPALTRMEAGQAENAFPGVTDGPFTYS